MENQNEILPTPQPEQSPQQTKKWYQHKGIISIIVLAVLTVGVCWTYFAKHPVTNVAPVVVQNQTKNPLQTQPVSTTTQTGNSEPTAPIPSGWSSYHNDVLGLGFSYPPKWGNITTYPIAEITNLKTVRDNIDNSFNPSLNINFSKNDNPNFPTSAPQITIWSPKYGGPQYNGAGMGHIDNLLNLNTSDNGCGYKISYQNSDSLKEIYSDCQNGVKVSVLVQTQHFDPASFSNDPAMPASGILYTYSLNYYGYKHLQNGDFDYLLASYTATSTRQQALQITSDDFLTHAGATQGNYPNFPEFASFVQSLRSYPPTKQQIQPFNTPAGEDPNITLIRQYYYDLLNGQASNAYQLTENPATSSEAFIADNQNIFQIQPRDFKKLSNGSYEYWVDYQAQNSTPTQERAVVEIVNGKIKQDLLDTLTSPVATYGNMSAYGASRGDKSIVLLRSPNSDVVIDSAANNFDSTLSSLIFDDVSFSPMGNYITYIAGGYEWAYLRVYNIRSQKQVLQTEGGTRQFNPTETLYYFCDKNDMGGDYNADVYSVPGFNIKLDLLKLFPELNNFDDVSCSENQQNNVIQFKFTGEMDKSGNDNPNITKTYNVDLQSGELTN
jgi:hypothetical protein